MTRYSHPILICLGYLALFVVAIPWYWPEGHEKVWMGFPLWVVVTLVASLAISIYTSWLFLKCWPDSEEGDDE